MSALALVLLVPSTGHACKKRHQSPFELYDASPVVAHVKVTSLPPPGVIRNRPGPGEVGLAALRVLKHTASGAAGSPGAAAAAPKTLTSRLGGTSCDVEFALSDEAVIFLGADGYPEGAHDGYLRARDAWLPVLDAWGQAKDLPARAAVLVDAATSPHPDLRREAVFFLLDEPALLAALGAAQRERLAAQARAKGNAPELALVLVRLRDPAASRGLPSWQKLARAMLRIRAYEAEADPARLAQAIESAKRPAERWAAFERCERARGAKLGRFSRYIQDLDRLPAKDLATSCRDGAALQP